MTSLLFFVRFLRDNPYALQKRIHREKCKCPNKYTYNFKENRMICMQQLQYDCSSDCVCEEGLSCDHEQVVVFKVQFTFSQFTTVVSNSIKGLCQSDTSNGQHPSSDQNLEPCDGNSCGKGSVCKEGSYGSLNYKCLCNGKYIEPGDDCILPNNQGSSDNVSTSGTKLYLCLPIRCV